MLAKTCLVFKPLRYISQCDDHASMISYTVLYLLKYKHCRSFIPYHIDISVAQRAVFMLLIPRVTGSISIPQQLQEQSNRF